MADMDDLERRTLAATIRRCKRSGFCRPVDVTPADEQAAISAGLLRFNEWPSGHYEITPAGQNFLMEVTE